MTTVHREAPPMIPLVTAAARLGLSWDSTSRLVLTGVLKGEKVGGRWYVEPASVEEHLRLVRAEASA